VTRRLNGKKAKRQLPTAELPTLPTLFFIVSIVGIVGNSVSAVLPSCRLATFPSKEKLPKGVLNFADYYNRNNNLFDILPRLSVGFLAKIS